MSYNKFMISANLSRRNGIYTFLNVAILVSVFYLLLKGVEAKWLSIAMLVAIGLLVNTLYYLKIKNTKNDARSSIIISALAAFTYKICIISAVSECQYCATRNYGVGVWGYVIIFISFLIIDLGFAMLFRAKRITMGLLLVIVHMIISFLSVIILTLVPVLMGVASLDSGVSVIFILTIAIPASVLTACVLGAIDSNS